MKEHHDGIAVKSHAASCHKHLNSMKRNIILRALALPILAAGLSACVDDNYDLSDIDTTSRVDVTDLTVPVNIEPVTIGDIIRLDPGSKIQVVNIAGQEFYALRQDGDFKSDGIYVSGVKASPSPIADTHETLGRIFNSKNARRNAPDIKFSYQMVEIGNRFSYDAVNIDPAIVSIDAVTTDAFKFGLSLEIKDSSKLISSLAFDNLQIRVPKGLTAVPSVGTYDSATGYWKIPHVEVSGNVVPVTLTATGIDMKAAGASISPTHKLNFNSEFIIEEGVATVTPSFATSAIPEQAELIVKYDLGQLNVRSFTGRIQYNLEGLTIPSVSLSDIPDFLRGADTNIELANPQIYLQLNNPLANVPLSCRTSLQLTALRNGLNTLSFQPEQMVEIGHDLGVDGLYNYVLTPDGDNLTVPPEYSKNLKRVSFNTLGSLLATPASWTTHGLPNRIGIELINPCVPEQHVERFAIPQSLSQVRGKYLIIAPIALCDGSKIIYTETRTGWSTDELDDLTITKLTVTALADNECPAAAQVYVYPIDTEGNEIEGVEISSTRLLPGQKSQLEITMTGEVRHLDGVRIMAVMEGHDGTPFTPSQTLTFTDIRAKVSGYYQRKL